MAKAIPAADAAESSARMRVFLAFAEKELKTNRTALARRLDVTNGALSQALKRGVSEGLRAALDDRIGLRRIYWTAKERLPPEQCMRPSAHARSELEIEIAVVRDRIQRIAREHSEPVEVLGALANASPPMGHEADPWWWFEEYLRVSHRGRTPRKQAS